MTPTKYVRHIPTQCCYEIDDEGIVRICGAELHPEIDGSVFWEYVDQYIEKVVTPSNPFHKE